MADFTYKVLPLRATSSPAFTEASVEELRVLIALVELGGAFESETALASVAAVSRPRCISAISFWEESGVIRRDDGAPTITDEFEERLVAGEIYEEESRVVADKIRDENLASMLDECASLAGLAALSNTEIKQVTGLCTQYALSPEYIVTLAAAIAEKGKLRIGRLVNDAIRLAERGIDRIETLETYLQSTEQTSSAEWEIRRVMGIYNRNLSKSERERFKKWSEEFGYSTAIISEAYDVAVTCSSGRGIVGYMDKVLTGWHEAGCKTVSECIAKLDADRTALAPKNSAPKKHTKTTPETPRYGDFDINDAFKKALERSYGEGSEEDK